MAGRATKKGTGVAKAKNPPDTIPKTGRGNPPKDTQFKKGVSGNKNGRPKGSKNLSTVLMEAAGAQVTAKIGGKQRKISKLQATAMQLATKAAGGHPTSVAKFLDWIDEIERRAAAAKPAEFPFSAADREVLYAVDERMRLCRPPQEGK